MTYTIETVEDLVRILDEHPQWLNAIRERVLTQELLALPEQFAQLTEQVSQLTKRMDQLAERMDQLAERMDQLIKRMDQLAEQMSQFKEETNQRFDRLERRLERIVDDLGELRGAHASNATRRVAPMIAGAIGLQYTSSLTVADLMKLSGSVDTAAIAANHLDSFHAADLIMEAADQKGEACYVAVEASYTVNGRDTERAIRHAQLLTRFTGRRSYAVVAGQRQDDRIRQSVAAGEVFWYPIPSRAMQAE